MKKLNLFLSTAFLATAMMTAMPSVQATEPASSYVKIAVFSDPHYYDPALGTSGEAFEKYLSQDRKLLAESEALLKATVDAIKQSDASIVLVSGDLTKDGEKSSHEKFVGYLKELEEAGKKVYVTVGNHDLNNPDAYKFEGANKLPTEQLSPEAYVELYRGFGYGEAIYRDPKSLSYIVEPTPGVWLVVMDSSIYKDNNKLGYPVTGGELDKRDMAWVRDKLRKAQKQGKLVLGMAHHGIVEHFSLQEEFFSEYVVNNWQKVSDDLANYGMKAVFTGHYHANDVVKKETSDKKFIFDIETGSLVTYPSPYRMITLNMPEQTMEVTTNKIDDIDYDMGGLTFPEYAKSFLVNGFKGLVPKLLAEQLMKQGLSAEQAEAVAQQAVSTQVAPNVTVGDLIVGALVAHYQGEEKADAQTMAIIQGMAASTDPTTKMLGGVLASLMIDPSVPDNNVTLNLKTGAVVQ